MQKAGEGVMETQGAQGQLTSSKGPEWGISIISSSAKI
jgi:hypothetical protein